MTRKTKHQNGQIFRRKKSWFGRWRRDELETIADGSKVVVRRQHCEKLCEYSDRYRSKKDVQPLLDEKVRPDNEGRSSAEATLAVSAYGDDFFLPWAERELKPSTAYGYKGLWRMYLKPRLTGINLRDFRCVDATKILAAIHEKHRLNRKSLGHCKALISSIFTHAKRAGILDSANPVRDAGLPRAAETGKPTCAYTADEVFAMLNALDGVGRIAVALMFFCGLRPGEARAARWENYDAKRKNLRIVGSMWRTHLTDPKTAESIASIPVAETLVDILAESRLESGYILAGPKGTPVDLHNLARRIVVPALARCAKCGKEKKEHGASAHEFAKLPTWQGWYALRRGLATFATSVEGTQMAAKSLLRHSNVATTQAFYIKSVPAEALRAVEKLDALFKNGGSDTLPI